MGDAYRNRQPQLPQSAGFLRQPHPEYVPEIPRSGMPSAPEVHQYLGRNDDREGPQVVDTQSVGLADDRGVTLVVETHSIGLAYDRYLESLTITEADTAPNNYMGVGLARAGGGARGPEVAPVEYMRRPLLPPGASNTLYIEGLPSDSTRREVAHIFRPFVGYKEVRLVRRDSKHRVQHAGDPLILGFVDFVNPACAAIALNALQGYQMDEHDSACCLRLQFSKFPGRRFGGSGSRGKR